MSNLATFAIAIRTDTYGFHFRCSLPWPTTQTLILEIPVLRLPGGYYPTINT